MKIIVNAHKCEIDKTPVNEKEINITKCEFEFAEEITNDFVKEAYFTLNGATTEVEKIKSRSEINMPPLKIVPITSGTRQGWAFVPTAGGDE